MATQFDRNSTTDQVLSGINLTGKRVLITGASSGLGIETARALAAHGATVIGAARDLEKAAKASEPVLRDAAMGGSFELIELDLASLASVRAAADALVSSGKSFDLVIANAGVMAPPFGRTADGFETQFGTNHLGHFVFINRIGSLMATGARLVVLASSSHRAAPVDLNDPNFEVVPYDAGLAYSQSKTANLLFAVEFDRRNKECGVRAVAVHPGTIETELGRHSDPARSRERVDAMNAALAAAGKPTLSWKTVPQGAATTVWAGVVAPADEIGGRYAENCNVVEPSQDGSIIDGLSAHGVDPVMARALWAKSEELVNEQFAE